MISILEIIAAHQYLEELERREKINEEVIDEICGIMSRTIFKERKEE